MAFFDQRPEDQCSVFANRWLALGVIVLAGLILRLLTPFADVYGEPDVARLVVDAELLRKGGVTTQLISEYRYYVSPGYIFLALGAGIAADALGIHVGYLLNGINALTFVVFGVAAYFLIARLTDRTAAFFAATSLLFMPVVFWGGAYGFPSLISVLALTIATLLYDMRLTDQHWLGRHGDLVIIVALLIGAALLKADMYLAAIGLIALQLHRRGWHSRELAFLIAILGIAPIVTIMVGKTMLAGDAQFTQFATGYQKKYGLELWRAYSWWYIEGWMMAFGLFATPIAVIGAIRMLLTGHWRLIAALLMWAGAPFLFWYFRIGDSMRHHLPEALPIAIGIGVAIGTLQRRPPLAIAALFVLLSVNYCWYPVTENGYRPSGRLVGSLQDRHAYVERLHYFGKTYAANPSSKKVILGTVGNPYADAEVLENAAKVTSARRDHELGYDQIVHDIIDHHGRAIIHTSVRVDPDKAPAAANVYQNAGYSVFSFEYDLIEGVENDLSAVVKLSTPARD
ncbi:MAG: hypothetical protein AAF384_06720 [Pseudomonadota bacterium]